MNYYAFGAGVALALILIGSFAYLHARIKDLENSLVVSKEEVKDDEIIARVHALSDDDLNSQMSDFLSRTDKSKT